MFGKEARIKMGCDHLLCERCKIGFDLEGGDAGWVAKFITTHWHSKKKIPSNSSWFPANHNEFPYHLIVKHRVPHGYISVREPVLSHKDENNTRLTFEREEVEKHIKAWNTYWTWWRKFLYYFESLWSAINGEYFEYLFEDEPYIVDKDNKKHISIVAFEDMWDKKNGKDNNP